MVMSCFARRLLLLSSAVSPRSLPVWLLSCGFGLADQRSTCAGQHRYSSGLTLGLQPAGGGSLSMYLAAASLVNAPASDQVLACAAKLGLELNMVLCAGNCCSGARMLCCASAVPLPAWAWSDTADIMKSTSDRSACIHRCPMRHSY